MGNITFNVALGMVGYYTGLPASTDQIIVVPLELTGLVTDDTLKDYATLATLLAGASNEQTTVGRLVVSGALSTVDNTANRRSNDFSDTSFVAATGNAIGALVVCYKPDSSAVDSAIIPLTKHDFVVTPNGGDIGVVVASTGYHSSTGV